MSWTTYVQVIGIIVLSGTLVDAAIREWGKARRR